MKHAAANNYVCPTCRTGSLVLHESKAVPGEILEGAFSCGSCSASFGIREGIPRFVRDDDYAGSFGFQWNKFRRTQLDSHTGLPLSANRLFGVSQWPQSLQGQTILEAGSGAGRFTEILLRTGATVFSFDLSSAVLANYENNGTAANLNLFQGSIYDIPLREGSCDKVLCLGVLQHTPDPEAAFASLARLVKPGGEIVVDVYAREWRSVLSWKYLLRPITVRLNKPRLFGLVEKSVDLLLPCAVLLRKIGGKVGARLLPILQYSHWGLTGQLNREWAVLDTFDMYSPAHDHPRSQPEVRRWFDAAGFEDVLIAPGPNGIVARGKRPN